MKLKLLLKIHWFIEKQNNKIWRMIRKEETRLYLAEEKERIERIRKSITTVSTGKQW